MRRTLGWRLLDHLGAIYRQQKRTDEALEVFRQSLAIIEEFDAKKLRTTHGGKIKPPFCSQMGLNTY